jgi:hypothetical protein
MILFRFSSAREPNIVSVSKINYFKAIMNRLFSICRPGFLVVVFLLAMALSLRAQDKDWRPVTPDELQSKVPVVEAGADAEAIFWEVWIDDTSYSSVTMRHYVRVKIFTELGREKYSKFDIPFTKGLKIKDLAARVIKPDGTITEIKKDDIFEREIIKTSGLKIKTKSFAVANIEPGVIVEYRYKEVFEDSSASGLRVEFQRDIPVRDLSYYYKPHQGEPRYKTFNLKDISFIKDKNGYYLASKSNVPAFKQEPYMPPDDMVRPWLRLNSGRISFWGMLGKFGVAQILKKDAVDLKSTALEIVSDASTDEQKVQRLYDYCQTNIANTTFDPTLTDEMRQKLPETRSLKDVLKRKSGSAPYIDMLFGGLAAALGMDARVGYVGDRTKMLTSTGNLDEEFLHPGAIAIQINGRWKFYNPGTKFMPIGKLVWYEEGTAAEVVGDKLMNFVQTPLSDQLFSHTERKGKFTLLEDGTLEGEVSIEMNGHPAIGYRLENYDEPPARLETLLKEDVKRQISTAEVSAVSIENLTDPTKPLIQRYKIKVPNYAQKTGKRLFLQPGVFEYGKPAIFSSKERKFDVYFRYPWSVTDTIAITYPKNYELDNADRPGLVSAPANIAADEIGIQLDKVNSTLLYDRKFHFGGGGIVLFKAQVYNDLKILFDEFHKADAHIITLKQN